MSEKRKLELYIHIPFCERKCRYCDFLSAPADETTRRAYVNQLIEEIRAQATVYPDYQISTVFLGGGTPSCLSGQQILNILSAVYESFAVDSDAEITIECNPGTLDAGKLEYFRESGINRVSLGLQSADNEELQLLGRIHTYEDFLQSFQLLREAGFRNINVDLMSAIPRQSVEGWRNTLRKVLMLKPEHISAYSLILEPGTPFYDEYSVYAWYDYLSDAQPDLETLQKTGFLPFLHCESDDTGMKYDNVEWSYTFILCCATFKPDRLIVKLEKNSCLSAACEDIAKIPRYPQ